MIVVFIILGLITAVLIVLANMLAQSSQKQKRSRKPIQKTQSDISIPTPTGTATTTPTKKMPTWVKPVLAAVTLVVAVAINLWGGEILSALKELEPYEFLWLLVLLPLLFFISPPEGLKKNAGSILGWGLAVAGGVVVLWFATQWWGDNGNEVVVNLTNNHGVPEITQMPLDDTLVILVPIRSTGRCWAEFNPSPDWWNNHQDMKRYGVFSSKFENKNTKYVIVLEEGFRSELRRRGITVVEIMIELKDC